MSTKATIAHRENFHLYDEVLDGGVYLEISNLETASLEIAEGGYKSVRVRLPKALIEHLKVDDQQLQESTSAFLPDSVSNVLSPRKI